MPSTQPGRVLDVDGLVTPGAHDARMAGFAGLSAVGKSLERVLNYAFVADPPIVGMITRAALVRAADIAPLPTMPVPALSILLYRVDFTKSMRSALGPRAADEGRSYLPLDLHYLMSPWADNAEHEHLIVGRTLQFLESLATLSGPTLDASGAFDPQESVSVVMDELSTDDLMRTYEALKLEFRLTLPYLARVLVVAGQDADPAPRTLSVLTAARP